VTAELLPALLAHQMQWFEGRSLSSADQLGSLSMPVVGFSDRQVRTMSGFEGAPSFPWSSGLLWSVPEVV
jgi:hypothetical protein